MRTHHQHLIEVDIATLRPTQVSVGLAEVEEKRAEWRALNKKGRDTMLIQHWFPAVLGPNAAYYIVDHHHLGLALHEEGVTTGWIMLLQDLSWLAPDVFWRYMEFHQWAHPYDERGQRCTFDAIPTDVTGLKDDPYRSLAGFVRHAGGYAKDTTPFAEFLWADFFRPRIKPELIRKDTDNAVKQAVQLARQQDARYLPGWSGEIGHDHNA